MKRIVFLVSGDEVVTQWVDEAVEWLATATQAQPHTGPGNVAAARLGKTVQAIPDTRNTIGSQLVEAGFEVVKVTIREQDKPMTRHLTNWGGQAFRVTPPDGNPVPFYRALEEVLSHVVG